MANLCKPAPVRKGRSRQEADRGTQKAQHRAGAPLRERASVGRAGSSLQTLHKLLRKLPPKVSASRPTATRSLADEERRRSRRLLGDFTLFSFFCASLHSVSEARCALVSCLPHPSFYAVDYRHRPSAKSGRNREKGAGFESRR